MSQIYSYAHLVIGDSSGKDYEKPCVTDTSLKKDHNVALIAAARRDMGRTDGTDGRTVAKSVL